MCERRKLSVNVDKSKVMVAGRDQNEETMEEVQYFKYMGRCFNIDGRVKEDVSMRVGEWMITFGAMKRLWNVRCVNVRAKRELYERVVVPTVMYGSGAWGLRVEGRKQLDVMELRC